MNSNVSATKVLLLISCIRCSHPLGNPTEPTISPTRVGYMYIHIYIPSGVMAHVAHVAFPCFSHAINLHLVQGFSQLATFGKLQPCVKPNAINNSHDWVVSFKTGDGKKILGLPHS